MYTVYFNPLPSQDLPIPLGLLCGVDFPAASVPRSFFSVYFNPLTSQDLTIPLGLLCGVNLPAASVPRSFSHCYDNCSTWADPLPIKAHQQNYEAREDYQISWRTNYPTLWCQQKSQSQVCGCQNLSLFQPATLSHALYARTKSVSGTRTMCLPTPWLHPSTLLLIH